MTYAAVVDAGPSVIGRVGMLLRTLASREPSGASTTALARAADLPRPTVHRMLTALVQQGLAERDEATGSWHLGPECFLLGAAATARHDITPLAREALRRIARETGESAFFSVRRGDETVCVLGEDGSFPIRSHVLYEGVRFPLGVASAGLVILAHLPERERSVYLADSDLTLTYGAQHSSSQIEKRVATTRQSGYAMNPGLIVEGSWGMAAAVFDTSGDPRWALTITGIEARFPAARREELGRLLLYEAHELTGAAAGTARGKRTRSTLHEPVPSRLNRDPAGKPQT